MTISSKNNLSHVKCRPYIDALRAFPKIFKAGFFWERYFFLILGYLIPSIIFRDLKDKSYIV